MAKAKREPAKRQRAPGGGRKKSTPMRQHLANFQPCRRSEPSPSEIVTPLSGDAPEELGQYGKFLWDLLVAQQATAAEKGIAPAITMERVALAHAYCSAFDRWAEVKQTIRYLEADLPPERRHLAKWHITEDGEYFLHGVWQAELKIRKEAVAAAKALGISSQHPLVSIKMSDNAKKTESDSVMRYVGPAREAAQIIDAHAEPSDD